MVRDASLDELITMEAALCSVGGERRRQARSFAHPSYVKALLDRKTGIKRAGGTRDLATLSPEELTWEEVLAKVSEGLKARPTPDSSEPGPTPNAVLELLTIAAKKGLLDDGTARQLARHLFLPIATRAGADGPVAARKACDVWPVASSDSAGIPEQVQRLLPRIASDTESRYQDLLQRLAPRSPSPTLVATVLRSLPTPSADTANWVLGVWKKWRTEVSSKSPEAPNQDAMKRAVMFLGLPGKGSAGFRPIADYYLNGFGDKGRGLEKSLTALLGPREPDLQDYGQRFTLQDFREIVDACKGQDQNREFVPTAKDIADAVQRLSHVKDATTRTNLAADFAIYMAEILEVMKYGNRRQEHENAVSLLQGQKWLPVHQGETLARPQDVVRIDDNHLVNLLQDALPVLAWPSNDERKKRFKAGLARMEHAQGSGACRSSQTVSGAAEQGGSTVTGVGRSRCIR